MAVLLLAVLPMATAGLAAVLLLLVNLETATCDLLHEGRYSELMHAKLKTGSTIVSFVWGCWSVGGLIASCIVGPVADSGEPQVVFCLIIITAIIFLLLFLVYELMNAGDPGCLLGPPPVRLQRSDTHGAQLPGRPARRSRRHHCQVGGAEKIVLEIFVCVRERVSQ